MKTYIKTIIGVLIGLSLPLTSFAITTTWQATSSTANTISPTAINGTNPSVTAGFYIGTSSATSTLTGGIVSPCFATSTAGPCITGGGGGSGTVTSVNTTVPTGFTGSGCSYTTSGTCAITYTAGYGLPLVASTTNWNNFYNASATLPYYIAVGTTSVNSITTLPNLSLPASQVTGLPSYTNYFTNSSATTSLTTGSILTAGVGTFGILNATTSTSTLTGLKLTNLATSFLAVDSTGNVIATTSPQAAGNYLTALTGDGTASGPGSAAMTLATVNTNTGSWGSSTAIPNFTVNGKGLITAAGTNAVVAPASTLSGTVLNSTVVTSSLTSVGTLGSLTVSATSTLTGLKLTNFANTVLGVDGSGNVIATTTSNINSVSNSDGTLTISPTTGAVVASLALGHANTWTGGQIFGNATSTNFFATSTVLVNATTTNLFATTASTTNLYGANLTACTGGSNALTWSSGSFGCNNITTGSGTVNSGTANQVAFYSTTGTAVSGTSNIVTAAASTTISNQFNDSSSTATSTFSGNLAVGSSTASTTFMIDVNGHIVTGGPQPSVSGGTSSMVSPSNDNSGTIAVAGTALTSVTMTFATPWTKTPVCTESDNILVTAGDITSISTTTLVIGFGTGGVTTATVWYQCSQPQ